MQFFDTSRLETDSPNTPLWLSQGEAVEDIYVRSGDAGSILTADFDSEELTVDWRTLDRRECDIPVEAFGVPYETMGDWCKAIRYEQPSYEEKRIAEIRAWMHSAGGCELALMQSPILATLRNGRLKIEDGYHRLGLAKIDYQASHVRVLCASLETVPIIQRENVPGFSL